MVTKICKFLNTLLIIILLLIAGIMVGPKLFGYETLAVLSGSMEPEISVGGLIIIKDVEPESLKVGDVITYNISSDTLVTHRIVDINQENQEIITKGDANDTNDGSPVNFLNVVGKLVFHVPLLGFISIYMQTYLGIAIICGLVVIILLLNYLPEILDNNKESK